MLWVIIPGGLEVMATAELPQATGAVVIVEISYHGNRL